MSQSDRSSRSSALVARPIVTISARTVDFNGQAFVPRTIHTEKSGSGAALAVDVAVANMIFGINEKFTVRLGVPYVTKRLDPSGGAPTLNSAGLGDTLLPLVVNPPAGNWLLGLGPTFTIPTSTRDAFGRQQWAVGPTGVLGYKTKKWVAVVFPQYFFGIGSRGDQGNKPDASYMAMLYTFFYNLPDAWQIGFNPTVTYDNKASSGNQWNVPIGLDVAKTIAIGGRPWKFQFGIEYSVVSQDTFGQEFQVKLNVIPVIGALIKKPLFGGG